MFKLIDVFYLVVAEKNLREFDGETRIQKLTYV